MTGISDKCNSIEISNLVQKSIPASDYKLYLDKGVLLNKIYSKFIEFSKIISELLDNVFVISKNCINIFYDNESNVVGFNSNNSIFLNLRCHEQLNYGNISPKKYWFIVICHELAHNEEISHNSKFSNIFENIVLYHLKQILFFLYSLVNGF